jgi:hypothetical protein
MVKADTREHERVHIETRMQREARDKELRVATRPPSWHLFNKTAQHIDAQLSAHLAHRHYANIRLEASE